jgi:hypothetical protein
MEVSGQFHAPGRFNLGKEPPSTRKDRRLCGPQSRSGRGGEEKKIPAPVSNNNHTVVRATSFFYTYNGPRVSCFYRNKMLYAGSSAYFTCKTDKADSSIVSNTLIDPLLNLNTYSSYIYHHTELSFFNTFHQFSHPLIIKVGSKL